jgi:matrixin
MNPGAEVRVTQRLAFLTTAVAIGTVLSTNIGAYVTNGVSWSQQPVPYSINTSNMDLPEAAVEPAVRAGGDVWATQSSASISLSYTGRSAQTTTGYDGLNLLVFRNASSGSAIATTYYWSSGGRLLDADIVFWDAAFRFFSGSTGCSGGFYIEDIAAHEFGHALGLGHSSITGATMYPSVSSCNAGNRTLATDDIAGIRFLYPTVAVPPGPPQNFRVIRD